jgi:hypothetical protein
MFTTVNHLKVFNYKYTDPSTGVKVTTKYAQCGDVVDEDGNVGLFQVMEWSKFTEKLELDEMITQIHEAAIEVERTKALISNQSGKHLSNMRVVPTPLIDDVALNNLLVSGWSVSQIDDYFKKLGQDVRYFV